MNEIPLNNMLYNITHNAYNIVRNMCNMLFNIMFVKIILFHEVLLSSFQNHVKNQKMLATNLAYDTKQITHEI